MLRHSKDSDSGSLVVTIPGSSIKGRVRHAFEQVAHSLGLMRHPPSVRPEDLCSVEEACPACRLFGSPWYPGSLRFSDARLEEPSGGLEPDGSVTCLRWGIAVSRPFHTVEEGRLYSSEVLAPGVRSTWIATVEGSASMEDLALLWAALRAVRSLGGSGRRGLGWCKIQASFYAEDRRIPDSEFEEAIARWRT